jgi:diamine N-acetyltransferase
MAIFPIGADALQRVQTLAQEIWPEAYAGILPADRIPPMLAEIYSLETLAADITERSHRYWLATVAAEDAGFASAYREDGRIWIKKLYVRSTIRGLGLGRRLIETAVAAFPGAASVGLFVNNGNASAIGFYRSQGFAIEAEVPVRMGPYDFTDFVMGKTIG